MKTPNFRLVKVESGAGVIKGRTFKIAFSLST
jgi:hypothetical protein